MKKILVVLIIVLALPASSLAFDLSSVLGGATGNLSDSNFVGSFFYAESGQEIALFGYPDYSSTQGLLAIGSIDDPTAFLATGYTTNPIYFTAPQSTLYLMVCVKSSGLSGKMLIGAIKSDGYGMLQSMDVEQQIPEDLIRKAKQKILEMAGQ